LPTATAGIEGFGTSFAGLVGTDEHAQQAVLANLGQFQPGVDLAAQQVGQFGRQLQGFDPFFGAQQLQRFGGNLQGQLGQNPFAGFGDFSQDFRQAGQFQQPLLQGFNQAAGQQLGIAGQDQGAIVSGELERLRGLARPGEQRAANSLADRLFGSGRLGTTGGAQMFGELAQAQERSDLERQGLALGLGRQRQLDAAGLAQQFQGAGQGIRGFQSALQGQAFGQAAQQGEAQRSRALSRFGIGQDVLGQFRDAFSTAQAGQQGALQNAAVLQSLGLQPLEFSLRAALAGAQMRQARQNQETGGFLKNDLAPSLLDFGANVGAGLILGPTPKPPGAG
jgi:hypothetical protein